jgi:hypothetical protein
MAVLFVSVVVIPGAERLSLEDGTIFSRLKSDSERLTGVNNDLTDMIAGRENENSIRNVLSSI